ncbi:GntR family transcriptional regulator [Occultella glacieicola]|uniref:GntR family transcriptional regulator n=1 Tax=Occultella glacieicola TaxID=2518684 RepID=A0ABY2E247_9MICO|nr:GntR family transcriptional regulator [Occultella glacieicola]TDE92683.1 GntR family transcriptional regulator [Occultella glacieicola]
MNDALYARVFASLQGRIESGAIAVGERLPTQSQLAEEFGVSTITIKHALDLLDRDGYIKRRPRLGSEVISRTAGPSPDRRSTTLPTIGCVLTSFDDSFGTRVLWGILDASLGRANVVLGRTEGFHDREQGLLAQYRDLGVDGLILQPGSSEWIAPAILDLVSAQLPLVILDRNLDGLPVSTVCSDNVASGRAAAEHLFGLGHRNIGLITSSGTVSTLDDRHRGFVYAHAEHGLAFSSVHEYRKVSSVVPDHEVSVADDLASLKEFLTANSQLTGFVASEHAVGLLLVRALRELELEVPRDVSVVSFDAPQHVFDDEVRRFTHIDQHEHALGEATLESVLAQLTERGRVAKQVLPTELVVGETTAPPRA